MPAHEIVKQYLMTVERPIYRKRGSGETCKEDREFRKRFMHRRINTWCPEQNKFLKEYRVTFDGEYCTTVYTLKELKHFIQEKCDG